MWNIGLNTIVQQQASRQKKNLKVHLVNVCKSVGPRYYICLGPPIH